MLLVCVIACAQVHVGTCVAMGNTLCPCCQQGGGHEIGEEVIYKGDTVKVVDRVQAQYGDMYTVEKADGTKVGSRTIPHSSLKKASGAPPEAVEMAR